MQLLEAEELLSKWVELAERTLKDHGLRLDANRQADFMQGIRETKKALTQKESTDG